MWRNPPKGRNPAGHFSRFELLSSFVNVIVSYVRHTTFYFFNMEHCAQISDNSDCQDTYGNLCFFRCFHTYVQCTSILTVQFKSIIREKLNLFGTLFSFRSLLWERWIFRSASSTRTYRAGLRFAKPVACSTCVQVSLDYMSFLQNTVCTTWILNLPLVFWVRLKFCSQSTSSMRSLVFPCRRNAVDFNY
jgi:hypothetical protein